MSISDKKQTGICWANNCFEKIHDNAKGPGTYYCQEHSYYSHTFAHESLLKKKIN